jgi:virulence-associated protein VapD
MPVPRQSSRDLEKALAKLRKAFENNQGACLLKHEAAAVYVALLEKLKQDANQEESSHV